MSLSKRPTFLRTLIDVKYAGAHLVMHLNNKTEQVESIAVASLGGSAKFFNIRGSGMIKFSSPAHSCTDEILYSLEFVQISLGGVAPNRGAIK